MRGLLTIWGLLLPVAAQALTCDGKADASDELQALLASSRDRVLALPAGQCVITKTLVVAPGRAIHVAGVAQGADAVKSGTALVWRGKSDGPVLELRGVRDSLFENLALSIDSSVDTIVRSLTVKGSTATNNTWRNLYLTGRGKFRKGFAFAPGDGGDANNDRNTFFNVSVAGYTLAGWSFEHAQSKAHAFYNSQFIGNRVGKYGLTTALGAENVGGSFIWNGGGGGANVASDFFLGTPDDTITIAGGNFESSARFLETKGNSSNPWPITLQGNRWAGDHLDPDGHAIIYTHRGALTLIGNSLDGRKHIPLDVLLRPTGPSTAVAIGNSVFTSLDDPFATTNENFAKWVSLGNTINYGPAAILPNAMPQKSPPD